MAVGYNPRMVTNGLVLCLDAGNTRSYPGSGITWTDLSGNGNNGTLTNGPTYSSSNGGSIAFDGVNDYVETNYVLPSSTSHTMELWAKSSVGNVGAGYGNRAMGNGDSTAGLSGTAIIWGAGASTQLYVTRRSGVNNGTTDMSYTVSDLLTRVHHVVVTYDHASTGSKLFVDGVQVATNANLGFTGSLTFRIGRDGNGTDAFNGNIYSAKLYNRALSAAEIRQNFNALRGRYGI
jgi:hypothetical protein